MISFKNARCEREFKLVHPKPREAVLDLATWCKAEGLPEVVVTHVFRLRSEQRAIYTPVARRLLELETSGRILSPMQRRDIAAIKALGTSDAALAEWAENRPSDHLWRCAVDLRNRHLTPAQLVRVMHRLRTGRLLAPGWQILSHDVGAGEHIHCGFRDAEWRARYSVPNP